MNYTYKQIWLINFPVMMSILMEQLINITDAVFLGHVGDSQDSPLISLSADWSHSLVSSGFEQVAYIGAFGPTETAANNWTTGWTNMDPQNTVY